MEIIIYSALITLGCFIGGGIIGEAIVQIIKTTLNI